MPYLYTPYARPQAAAWKELTIHLNTLYYGAGIINPLGPTLNVIIGRKFIRAGESHVIYRLSLNPFSQRAEALGELVAGEDWSDAASLATIFNVDWGSCPTWLLPSAFYDGPSARALFGRFLPRFADGRSTWARVRRYRDDSWARVKADCAANPVLPARGRSSAPPPPAPLSATMAANMARWLLQPYRLKDEFWSFIRAWETATSGDVPPSLSTADFLTIFTKISLTARLPFRPNLIDNPEMVPASFPRSRLPTVFHDPRRHPALPPRSPPTGE